MRSKHILITGASGLIGQRLTELLIGKGYEVSHLGRSKRKDSGIKSFVWNIHEEYIEEGALQGIDAIVHLAGAGVADKPWTKSRKQEILNSRILSTALLRKVLSKARHSVSTFVSASAIGYYGFADDMLHVETDAAGTDFLANVTRQWEQEVDTLGDLVRTVKVRVGVVLSRKGGALVSMEKPIRFYAGAALGSGRQVVSWIHLDDLCGIFIKAIEDESMRGAYNAVAPTAVTNKELTAAIARAVGKPLLLPNVPGFVLKLVLGEMANLVLGTSRVSAEKIIRSGFEFEYPTVETALSHLYGVEPHFTANN